MKNKNIMVTLALIVIFTGAGFLGGTVYQKTKSVVSGARFNLADRNGGPQNGRARMGGGQIMGDIIAADDKSITVKLTDGTSKIILVSSTTTINKAASAAVADLKVGEKVAAFGATNTDGSVTASNIQLNPIARGPQPSATSTK